MSNRGLPFVWQIIFKSLFILNLRPIKTAKACKEIWMKKKIFHPLLYLHERTSKIALSKLIKR